MFLNPLMLAGIGGAAVPLVLHLLARARYRSVDWGAMMFLTDVDMLRQRHRMRLKEWTLLLLRMAIVAMLAIALARPTIEGRLGGLAGNGRATAVIILDDSASMNREEDGRTRLEQARQVVLQILAAMNRGDQVSFMPTGTPQTTSERAPTTDLQSIAARVAAVQPGAGQADFSSSLSRAGDILERYERVNREIYIVTDRQAMSWRRINEFFRRSWRNRWAPGGSGAGPPAPRVTVFTVGNDAADNVAIESIDLPGGQPVKDQPAQVEVRVRNYGGTPRSAVPVTISLGNPVVARSMLALAADASATVRATIRFPDAGARVITAALKSTGLTSDDRLDRVVDVSGPAQVLILSDDAPVASSNPTTRRSNFESATELVQLALAPYATARRPGADPAVVTVKSPSLWPASADLDRFDVVILLNVARLNADEARDLEQYAYGGGGILIAPGNLTHVDDFNAVLFRGGSGISPASLAPPKSADTAAPTALGALSVNHPLFRFLGGGTAGAPRPPPSDVEFNRWFPATPRASDARVIASYASGGSPFVIEGTAGRGRLLLFTVGLDGHWSTLPQTDFFLPLLQSAVRYLSTASSPPEWNLTPGQPIVASVEDPVDERSATLRLPSGQTEAINAVRFDYRTEMRFTRTEMAGVYTLRYRTQGHDKTLHYAVASPRSESDLTPMTSQQWDGLAQAVGLERFDPAQTAVASAVARDRTGRELWAMLVAGVIALAMVEIALARIWSSSSLSSSSSLPPSAA
jgi:hypothetical protein